MNKWRGLLIGSLLLALCAPAWAVQTDPGIPEGYVLAFSDEFSQDGAPDAGLWTLEEGAAQYNEELQCYSADNAWVEGGNLVIEARREPRDGMAYTSARLNTQEQFSFCYGRLEARVALPDGLGTWAALWMLPSDLRYGGWLASGEIDIMEHVGYDAQRVYSIVHTQEYNSLNENAIVGSALLEGDAGDFHEYVLMWDQQSIECYLDGQLLNVYRPRDDQLDDPDIWPFDVPFHIVVNLAIGGTWGGLQGIDDQCFPQRMLIDYIRVYTPALEG